MANAYPTLPTLRDSYIDQDGGIDPERATNGTLRVRVMFPADKRQFNVAHILTATQKANLDAFYAANKLLDVDYRWPPDGVVYVVRFAAPPQYRHVGRSFEARVRLLEV